MSLFVRQRRCVPISTAFIPSSSFFEKPRKWLWHLQGEKCLYASPCRADGTKNVEGIHTVMGTIQEWGQGASSGGCCACPRLGGTPMSEWHLVLCHSNLVLPVPCVSDKAGFEWDCLVLGWGFLFRLVDLEFLPVCWGDCGLFLCFRFGFWWVFFWSLVFCICLFVCFFFISRLLNAQLFGWSFAFEALRAGRDLHLSCLAFVCHPVALMSAARAEAELPCTARQAHFVFLVVCFSFSQKSCLKYLFSSIIEAILEHDSLLERLGKERARLKDAN